MVSLIGLTPLCLHGYGFDVGLQSVDRVEGGGKPTVAIAQPNLAILPVDREGLLHANLRDRSRERQNVLLVLRVFCVARIPTRFDLEHMRVDVKYIAALQSAALNGRHVISPSLSRM